MEETAQKKVFSANSTGLIAFVVVVLVLISLGAYIAGRKDIRENPPTQGKIEDTPKMTTPLAPKTIVYGTWTQSNSQIKSIDLSDGKYQILASLPVNIKKVTVASPDTLIYINQTDDKDHGKEIAVYSLSQNKNTVSVQAASEFGIDDYVVSPNKNYLATWELAFAPGSAMPRGGRSRVYTVNLANPSVKNLIYDEEATDNPVHYPRAILDNGKVFLDTYLANDPNGGAGGAYAYGMSVSNFEGNDKQDLDKVKNGTYGTQPSLSADGTKLAFAGYDGALGPGDAVKNGYRQALLTPNTVDTLDVNTLERTKLANLQNANTYSSVRWDKATGNLLLSIIGKDSNNNGLHKYTLATGTLEKINTKKGYKFITTLSPEKTLRGTTEDSDSALANLGEGYQPIFRQFILQDSQTSQEVALPLPDPLMQYIGFVPSGYFIDNLSSAQGVEDVVGNPAKNKFFLDLYSSQNQQKDNLQLYTFLLKSDLAPKRLEQQNGEPPSKDGKPRCRALAAEQCKEKGLKPGTKEFDDCEDELKDVYKDQNACYDSPLYLYGTQGQKVKVNLNTYVYNTDPIYQNGYDVTLLKDGKMLVNGTQTDSIKYDYTPGIKKITPPLYGTVTTLGQLSNVLNSYANSLGLNQKETQDLISFAQGKVTSPYVFVSFFNQEKSEEILPLSFSPKPDNYLNIVFYFKQYDTNPAYTPVAPVFTNPLNRTGFTAVEISGIVE